MREHTEYRERERNKESRERKRGEKIIKKKKKVRQKKRKHLFTLRNKRCKTPSFHACPRTEERTGRGEGYIHLNCAQIVQFEKEDRKVQREREKERDREKSG